MQNRIKTGVIGFGLAGKVFHTPFVNAVPGLELSYIVQRTGNQAQERWPQVTVFRSAEELFASDVQLVVVGTPNETHYNFAKQALLAGKHVVVDKPVTHTSEQAAELESLSADRSLIYAPFHNRRWDGDFLTARSVIESGQLGRIVTFESQFERFRPTIRPNSWKESAGDHQSAVMDLGPHLVDQAVSLFGRPDTVQATVRTDRDNSQIEDAFDITLKFTVEGRPVHAFLHFTLIAAEPSPRFLIHGTKGSFRKYGTDPQEPTLLAGATVPELPDDTWLYEDESAWGSIALADTSTTPVTIERKKVPTLRGDYRNFYVNVRDAILGKTALTVTPRDAFRTMRLLELARQSNLEGRTLAIQDKDW